MQAVTPFAIGSEVQDPGAAIVVALVRASIVEIDILPRLEARDSYRARKAALNPLSSRFGGFLLLAMSYIAHFTGATDVSRPEHVDRADPVGVFLETTGDAGEP